MVSDSFGEASGGTQSHCSSTTSILSGCVAFCFSSFDCPSHPHQFPLCSALFTFSPLKCAWSCLLSLLVSVYSLFNILLLTCSLDSALGLCWVYYKQFLPFINLSSLYCIWVLSLMINNNIINKCNFSIFNKANGLKTQIHRV